MLGRWERGSSSAKVCAKIEVCSNTSYIHMYIVDALTCSTTCMCRGYCRGRMVYAQGEKKLTALS